MLKNALVSLVDQWIKGASDALPKATGVFGRPTTGSVTQEFGMTDFAAGGAYAGRGHSGMDIANSMGTAVYAADGGTVEAAGPNGNYGNYIRILHDATKGLKTAYGHLQTILVAIGEVVRKNQKIGTMDSTGYSTGSHLHFEVQEGGSLRNPRDYVALASGGVVTKPTYALIGESGPEAVVPLHDLAPGNAIAFQEGLEGYWAGMPVANEWLEANQVLVDEMYATSLEGLASAYSVGSAYTPRGSQVIPLGAFQAGLGEFSVEINYTHEGDVYIYGDGAEGQAAYRAHTYNLMAAGRARGLW